MTAARVAGLSAALGIAWLFASCGTWVTLGPLVECGRKCSPPQGAGCDLGVGQYNRSGECVCGEVRDCPGFVCEPSPPLDYCFIAQISESGKCECTVPLEPEACGQPCAPAEPTECATNRFEFNGAAECVCAPAVCPCGQPCVPLEPSPACLILHQYNEAGLCSCAPVDCSACDGNPCCDKTCGEDCELPGCSEGDLCVGQCNKENTCVIGVPNCDPIPK